MLVIADLAFGNRPAILTQSKVAVLFAPVVTGVLANVLLRWFRSPPGD